MHPPKNLPVEINTGQGSECLMSIAAGPPLTKASAALPSRFAFGQILYSLMSPEMRNTILYLNAKHIPMKGMFYGNNTQERKLHTRHGVWLAYAYKHFLSYLTCITYL